MGRMPHVFYCYGANSVEEYYGFVKQQDFAPYEKERRKKRSMHQLPAGIRAKMRAGTELTPEEQGLVRQYNEMGQDLLLEPRQRKRGVVNFDKMHDLIGRNDADEYTFIKKDPPIPEEHLPSSLRTAPCNVTTVNRLASSITASLHAAPKSAVSAVRDQATVSEINAAFSTNASTASLARDEGTVSEISTLPALGKPAASEMVSLQATVAETTTSPARDQAREMVAMALVGMATSTLLGEQRSDSNEVMVPVSVVTTSSSAATDAAPAATPACVAAPLGAPADTPDDSAPPRVSEVLFHAFIQCYNKVKDVRNKLLCECQALVHEKKELSNQLTIVQNDMRSAKPFIKLTPSHDKKLVQDLEQYQYFPNDPGIVCQNELKEMTDKAATDASVLSRLKQTLVKSVKEQTAHIEEQTKAFTDWKTKATELTARHDALLTQKRDLLAQLQQIGVDQDIHMDALQEMPRQSVQ
jgi:hypothetical protein